MEGWRLRLEAPGVPEPQPAADEIRGLASTEVGRDGPDRLEALPGLLDREGRRPAGVQG